jgi:hypothetical protein
MGRGGTPEEVFAELLGKAPGNILECGSDLPSISSPFTSEKSSDLSPLTSLISYRSFPAKCLTLVQDVQEVKEEACICTKRMQTFTEEME